jgi:ATP/ADP translocase
MNKRRLKTIILASLIGLFTIQAVGEIYHKCVIDKLFKKEIQAERYAISHPTTENYQKTSEYYGNLFLKSSFWLRIISMFMGGIVMGYIIGKGGWKFAATVILLVFLLQDLPIVIHYFRETNPVFRIIKYSSPIAVLFGMLGGVIGEKLKLRTHPTANS